MPTGCELRRWYNELLRKQGFPVGPRPVAEAASAEDVDSVLSIEETVHRRLGFGPGNDGTDEDASRVTESAARAIPESGSAWGTAAGELPPDGATIRSSPE